MFKRFLNSSVLILIILVLSSCAATSYNLNENLESSPNSSYTQTQQPNDFITPAYTPSFTKPSSTTPISAAPPRIVGALQPKILNGGKLQLSFIDVGQADCILITVNDAAMLIDAGNNSNGAVVISYLKEQGINKLDYIIGTHPHADHIGGIDNVIKAFDIGYVIMPKVQHTTKTFEDVLTAISSKGLKINSPVPGATYSLGDASFMVLAPNSSSYKSLNNHSIIIKVTYVNNSFLLVGDAEDESETEMLNKGYYLKADVLKVGHHGSSSSTSTSFLEAVKPKYAIISVGAGNTYKHPTASTLSKLKNAGVQIFRTDESGTIIVTSDGNDITVEKSK